MLGNSTRKDLVNDDPLTRDLWSSLEVLKRWRYPNFSPFMLPDLYAVVMDGFETQATTPSPAPVVGESASDGDIHGGERIRFAVLASRSQLRLRAKIT
jgi:hypothetical protein